MIQCRRALISKFSYDFFLKKSDLFVFFLQIARHLTQDFDTLLNQDLLQSLQELNNALSSDTFSTNALEALLDSDRRNAATAANEQLRVGSR